VSVPESRNSPESHNFRREIRLAWAAGFLDGEGCIHIAKQRYRSKRSATYRLGVHVTQNDQSVLERFREAVGIDAPIYRLKRAKNHRRQCFTLNFSGHRALALITVLLRYLERKRNEAQAALDFWAKGRVGVRFGARGLDPALVAVREHYFLLLKQLK
jgi:LAGLIDADG endonuclease